MSKRVLLLGPYVGSFESEFMVFRPYIKWLQNCLDYDMYVTSSHFNRKFMYDGKFLPIYKQLSRREDCQTNYIHDDVKQKDYNILIKTIKDKISTTYGISKKNIDVMSIPYNKVPQPISIYYKSFQKVKVPVSANKGNILYIPHGGFDLEKSQVIYNHIKDRTVSVIGDTNTHLSEYNELLSETDYVQNGYFKLITAITNSKCVITPCSFWTAVANLQGVPVFSWGDVTQYREGGNYNFSNKNCKTITFDGESDINILLRHIDSFVNNL